VSRKNITDIDIYCNHLRGALQLKRREDRGNRRVRSATPGPVQEGLLCKSDDQRYQSGDGKRSPARPEIGGRRHLTRKNGYRRSLCAGPDHAPTRMDNPTLVEQRSGHRSPLRRARPALHGARHHPAVHRNPWAGRHPVGPASPARRARLNGHRSVRRSVGTEVRRSVGP
jgi:hypothetical protein